MSLLAPLLPVSFVFPGALLPQASGEDVAGFWGHRILVSAVFNSTLYWGMLQLGIFKPLWVSLYLTLGLFGLLFAYRRKSRNNQKCFPSWQEVLEPDLSGPALVLTGLAGLASFYWAWFFPPFLWDSTFYHLPLAQIFASPDLLALYTSFPETRMNWFLEGAVGANALELFMSQFFLFDSKLYKLVPPILSLACFLSVISFARFLSSRAWTQLAAIVLLATAPVVAWQAGDYYIDFFLAGYVAASVHHLLAVYQILDRETSPPLQQLILLGLLLGGSMVVKKTGLFVLIFPALLLLPRLPYLFQKIHQNNSQLGGLWGYSSGIVGVVALLVSGRYLLKLPFLPSYPALPDAVQSPALAEYWAAFVEQGVPALLWAPGMETINGWVIVAAFLLGGILYLSRPSRSARPSFPGLYSILVGLLLWGLIIMVGITQMNRPGLFKNWGRYLLPLYGISCVLVPVFGAHLSEHRSNASNSSWLKRYVPRFVLFLLIGSVLFFGSNSLQPWLKRARTASVHPLWDTTYKQQYLYGSIAQGWNYINQHAHPQDRVLSDDTRIFFLEPPAWGLFMVPEGLAETSALEAWLRDHNVRWILETSRTDNFRYSDEHRGTSLIDFLNTHDEYIVFRQGGVRIWDLQARGSDKQKRQRD